MAGNGKAVLERADSRAGGQAVKLGKVGVDGATEVVTFDQRESFHGC